MRVLGISGSLRSGSLNTALLRETGAAREDMDEDWGTVVSLRIGANGVC